MISNTDRERKYRYIDLLVIRARKGNAPSLNKLLELFNKLIYKISTRIHYRSHGKISIEELHRSGQQEFRRLTLMCYIPNGRAHFNRYIESAVHAELWKYYRPLTKDCSADYMENLLHTEEMTDPIVSQSVSYAIINLSQSEQKIITDCVMNGRQCTQEAKLLGVSKVRVSQIKNRALKKLRNIVESMGINENS